MRICPALPFSTRSSSNLPKPNFELNSKEKIETKKPDSPNNRNLLPVQLSTGVPRLPIWHGISLIVFGTILIVAENLEANPSVTEAQFPIVKFENLLTTLLGTGLG